MSVITRPITLLFYQFKKYRHTYAGYVWLIMVLFALPACNRPPTSEITVSAAANLIPAFEKIGQHFEAENDIRVIYNFGSSGQLAQQIEQGAPVDVFASANADYILQLAQKNRIKPQSMKVYALGRLVVWGVDSTLVPTGLTDLSQPTIKRIGIANPEHAPYGIVAKTVLTQQNLWSGLRPKMIVGADARQALTLAETGDVTVGLVPLSLVYQLNEGAYMLVPTNLHPPIEQMIGIVQGSNRSVEAQQFIDFVLSDQGQIILQQFGYESTNP